MSIEERNSEERKISELRPIEWSEEQEPDAECWYNHVIGATPLGDFLITWKGCKENPSFDVDEVPFYTRMLPSADSLEEAKKICQDEYFSKLNSCLLEPMT